jgi:hypothetical protein
MTMDPQLLTADDVTAADFLTFTYSELDKLVAQLIKVHKAAAEAKQRAILYHKFDAPPKNYSEDFNSLLSIRYGGSKDADAESFGEFLLNLSLPAFLQVIYSLTRKHLTAGKSYLPDFAKHADKHAELKESLVNRARLGLQKDPNGRRVDFERDVHSCREGDPSPHMPFVIFTNIVLSKPKSCQEVLPSRRQLPFPSIQHPHNSESVAG